VLRGNLNKRGTYGSPQSSHSSRCAEPDRWELVLPALLLDGCCEMVSWPLLSNGCCFPSFSDCWIDDET